MKKILFTATSNGHLRLFHIPYLKWLKDQGYIVHAAVNCRRGEPIDFIDNTFCLPLPRKIFSRDVLKSYKKLRAIINTNQYDLISTHTPIPGFLTRLAAIKARKKGTKVLYTSHGFHFYNGAPKKSWLTYYLAEAFLSKFSDAIVTINNEDFQNASSGLFSCKNVYKINGIGLNPEKLDLKKITRKAELRKSYGFKDHSLILIYIAEFTKNKNHKFILDALPSLKKRIPEIEIIFAGKGNLFEQSKEYAKRKGIGENVHFMGFRSDIDNLIVISDIGVSVSKREGLPINILEEMYMGLPVIASNIRGHKDIVEGQNVGFLFYLDNMNSFIDCIDRLYKNVEIRREMGLKAQERAFEFSIEKSLEKTKGIYKSLLR